MLEFIYYKTAFLAFFFIQGLIFALLLLKKGIEQSNRASKWLSLFVFLCCLYVTPWMLGHANWYAKDGYREFLFFVPFHQLFLLGPVIYRYTQTLLNPAFQARKRDALHFLPAALYLLYSFVVFIVDHFLLDDYYFYADGRDKDLAPWYQISGLISMIIYVVLSIRLYNQYRQRIFEELSYADTVIFNWIKRFLIVLLSILVMRIVFLVLFPEWGDFGMKWWYYLFFAVLSYYIAFAGYTNVIRAMATLPSSLNGIEFQKRSELVSAISLPKSQNADVSEASLREWKTQVLDLMEKERMYQNPTLTLTDVATALGTNTRQVSYIINQGFTMNFNDFVNHYRVEAVKQQFEQGEQQKYTVLSIALAAGFNSKTTFNRVFKKRTGLTPVQYLSNLKIETEDRKEKGIE